MVKWDRAYDCELPGMMAQITQAGVAGCVWHFGASEQPLPGGLLMAVRPASGGGGTVVLSGTVAQVKPEPGVGFKARIVVFYAATDGRFSLLPGGKLPEDVFARVRTPNATKAEHTVIAFADYLAHLPLDMAAGEAFEADEYAREEHISSMLGTCCPALRALAVSRLADEDMEHIDPRPVKGSLLALEPEFLPLDSLTCITDAVYVVWQG